MFILEMVGSPHVGPPQGYCLRVPAGPLHQAGETESALPWGQPYPLGALCLAYAHCPCGHYAAALRTFSTRMSSVGSEVLALNLAFSPDPNPSTIPNPDSSLDPDCYLDLNSEPDQVLILTLTSDPCSGRVSLDEQGPKARRENW